MIYAVIMAGGKGTRLWPQSRENMPKQLWKFSGQKSLLQTTIERVAPIIPAERALILTVGNIYQEICCQLPEIPPRNVVVEPVGRSTAPCVGLAALFIDDPDACMVILPSDHVISNTEEFLRKVRLAVDMAADGEHLVTFGIQPTGPETGFGYIQRGQQAREGVYDVRKFTEKPDLATARRFVDSGEYYWNSGMFIWKKSTLMTMIERYLPDLHKGLMTIQPAIGTPDEARIIAEVFEDLASVSIDYGIMEKAETTYVVPVDFGWNDVGSWAALPEVWGADDRDNTLKGKIMALESQRNIVYADHGLVSLIGVEDLIVVKVKDTVLVCHKEQAQQVKDMVELLEQKGMSEYL